MENKIMIKKNIKVILMSYNNNYKLKDITLRSLNDIILYIKKNYKNIRDEDLIDISFLKSYLKKIKNIP